jgi:general secretion pathway protein D
MKPRRSSLLRLVTAALAALALAGLAPSAAAQAPAATPTDGRAPATPAAALVPIPPSGDGAAMLDPFKLSDEDLPRVLDVLETLTGRSVIRPQQLPTPKFTFNSRGPISTRDAIIAIESLLSLNNIAVAPLGEKFIKVVVITSIKTEAPELVLGTLRDCPPSGRIVSKLFRLEHLDTNSFQTQVQPFLSPGFGAVVPFQNSNTLLVTDTISNLQRLEYVLMQVDKPRDLVTQFYTLKFAQAQAVAEKIKSLIETTRTAFNRQNGQGAAGSSAAPNAAPAPAAEGGADSAAAGLGAALISATTSINFDERTNQVILVTDTSSVQFYQNLIEKLDVQADPSTQIAVIQIQHAQATDVASLLSTFISGSSSTASRSGSSSNGSKSSRKSRSTETFPGIGRNEAGNSASQPRLPQAVAAGGAAGERNSQFSDFMTIIADERSNAIVASGTQDDLNLIRSLIKQIDVVLPQVQIDVLIASVTLTDTVQRGIDAFTGIKVEGNKVVGILGAAASGSKAAVSGVTGPGFDISQILMTGKQSFTANVGTPNTKSNVRVLSVPSITTTHNQEATITVAKAVPIITSAYSDTTAVTTARNSYSYQNIGLELTVKPLIGSDGTIQMEIEQSADEIDSYNADDQPLISKRTAKSFISVGDGEIIVLAGMQKDTKGKTRNGMPLISEIPLLGALFGSNKTEKNRDEIVFFIQPRVIRTTAEGDRLAREQAEGSATRKLVEKRIQRTAVIPADPVAK